LSTASAPADNGDMHEPALLAERSLLSLLESASRARLQGLVVVRCRAGLRHGLWLDAGHVVGAHLADGFDPLLELLRREGSLSPAAHLACLRDLASGARAGELALRAGVPASRLREVLQRQLVARTAELFGLARDGGHDGWFEARPVCARDTSVRMPLGALLRRVLALAPELATLLAQPQDDEATRRRALRLLARALHPDLQCDDPLAQRAREQALARATARYHGLAST
jgi:hypothetical protein